MTLLHALRRPKVPTFGKVAVATVTVKLFSEDEGDLAVSGPELKFSQCHGRRLMLIRGLNMI